MWACVAGLWGGGPEPPEPSTPKNPSQPDQHESPALSTPARKQKQCVLPFQRTPEPAGIAKPGDPVPAQTPRNQLERNLLSASANNLNWQSPGLKQLAASARAFPELQHMVQTIQKGSSLN